MQKTARDSADHILPLYMNGLSGRMLKLPAYNRNKREILLIGGIHTSIERVIGLGEYLNRYGSVTSPDLPGFGGMQSFYKIGEKPTIDNLADYLASFIKLRYKGRRFSIIAVSFGFPVVTRMLQKYPDIVKKVDLLISIAGFVSKNDFGLSKPVFWGFNAGTWLFSHRIPAAIGKAIFLHAPVIKGLYGLAGPKHAKLAHVSEEERDRIINFEVGLWKSNDLRTYMQAGNTMFSFNLSGSHVDLMVYHVAVDEDHFLNNLLVEQNMRTIYKDFELIKAVSKAHAPTVIASAKEASYFVPPRIRALLRKKPD